MLNRLSLKFKLLSTMILVSLVPLVLVTFIALNKASEALHEEAVAKFTAVQQAKRSHIEDYFVNLFTAVKSIAEDPFLHQCMTTFENAFESAGNTVDDEMWRTLVEFKEQRIKEVVAAQGFRDLMLISTSGNIIYTAAKNADIGKNLIKGDLVTSGLGRAFAAIQNSTGTAFRIEDFETYAPAGGQQVAFILSSMRLDGKKLIGYIAVQLPIDPINAIVQQRAGIGKTGESYLVGKSNGATALRSDRVVKPGRVGDATSDAFIDNALNGQSGNGIKTGSTGEREFIRFDPVKIDGLAWCLITTGAEAEVFAAVDSLRNTSVLLILVVAGAVLVIALYITGIIVRPINNAVAMLKDIAEGEGDLTKRLAVKTRDEMGDMAVWFNTFMEKLQGIITQIASDANHLSGAAANLADISGQMSGEVESMSLRAEQVAAASGEMSDNMNNVAAASEQAATNVNLVAAATEEMTATVGEIAKNSEKARNIAESAAGKAVDASTKVDKLGHAANEISKVTEVITEISEQTNLLALNATIEAARAGEAGKGFAVVANEIKELAKQTAASTMEIKNRIDGIQGSTRETVEQIGEISGVIGEVNAIVATIATAVEEQSSTSREIAGNVAQASEGIQDVNENVSQSSKAASGISSDIVEVNGSVKEIADSSSQVKQSAATLSGLSEKLQDMVGRFRV